MAPSDPNRLDAVLDVWRAGHDEGLWDRVLERADGSEGIALRGLLDRLRELDEALDTGQRHSREW